MTLGAYPGSFNPATVAHLAIAEAAWRQCGLERLDLVVSRSPLGKEPADLARLEDRLDVLERIAASRPWLGVRTTDARLLADVAEGYDVLIVGGDKWLQLIDPVWYGGSELARDEALRRIRRVVVAPRRTHPVAGCEVLDGHQARACGVVNADAHFSTRGDVAQGGDDVLDRRFGRQRASRAVSDSPRGQIWAQGTTEGQDGDAGLKDPV